MTVFAMWTGEAVAQDKEQIDLAGEVSLLRLVDLSAQRLGLHVEYDADALRTAKVTLRLDHGLDDDALWALANQMLVVRGFTSVEPTGHAQDGVISIVRLSDAAGLARIERELPLTTRAGFAGALVRVQHRTLKDVSEAAKALLSKPGGSMTEVPGENAVIISDLTSRVEMIIDVIQGLDVVDEAIVIHSIEARYLAADSLASLITSAVTSSSPSVERPFQGRVLATPDNRTLILIAPGREVERWKALIAQFDRPSDAETRTYAASGLTSPELTEVIEQTARDTGPRGSGAKWRLVHDALSGLLVITATPSEHEQIAAVLNRVKALPAEARRPVRAFAIRNRGVREVVEVLSELVNAGVLEGAEFANANDRKAGPSRVPADMLQRTDASVQTPASRPAEPNALSVGLNGAQEKPAVSWNQRLPPAHVSTSLVLSADEGTNTLIAVGEPRKLAQLEELLRTIDVRQPQVMIEVLVVSLNEGDTLDLGVELEKIEISGDTVITLSSLFGLGPAAGAAAGKGFSGLILNPGDFRVLIRALQTLNNGRSLNMPRVLVNNNQQANLDAVVQQPFVSTNASDTVATTSFGGFENAGTTISIKPQIAKGDHLVLEYSVSLSAFVGESSDPGIPPPRQQNNLQSIVTIPDGYTVVVGGIEISTQADATSQVPLIGDIPWIGEAFKSRSRSKSLSRFFIFIRPTILRNEGFEDLKYLSGVATRAAVVSDGFPEVEPRIIR